MKMNAFLIFGVLLHLLLIWTISLGQSNPEMDWDKVTLKIQEVRTVPQIENNGYRLVPKPGQQLVALDIEGQVQTAMDVKLNPSNFTAKIWLKKIEASAVGVKLADGQFMWGISGSVAMGIHMSPTIVSHYGKDEKTHFSVCFLLDNKIDNFKLVVGKETVSVKIPK